MTVRRLGFVAATVAALAGFGSTPRAGIDSALASTAIFASADDLEGRDAKRIAYGRQAILLAGSLDSAAASRLAGRTGAVVAAPDVSRADGHLAVVLAAPGRRPMQARASRPTPPLSGVAFSRPATDEALPVADLAGLRIGAAAIGDADSAIPRLADLGADLVMLTGGPVSPRHVERMAASARAYRVAILIAGHCTGTRDCVGAAAIDRDGSIDLSDAARHRFAVSPRWRPPTDRGLPPSVPLPSRFPATPALAELGRSLFFDPRLSANGDVSCASCHDPSRAFADARRRGVGNEGRTTTRNVPSLLNVAFRPSVRWDGYPAPLEIFVGYPLSGRNEMGAHDLRAAADRVAASSGYRDRFAAALDGDQVDFAGIARALAAYMRTLVSGDSPFDRAVAEGQRGAMPEAAWRGYALFTGRAGCSSCHAYSPDTPFFTDFGAHATGLGWEAALGRYRDPGAGAIAASAADGAFRTPSLRDVARTAPYMHDGSIATLRGVIDYFDRGGGNGPNRDPRLRRLNLSERDKRDLEAFLIALTGRTRYDAQGRRIVRD